MSYSQDVMRDALSRIDGMVVFKPADDSRNWKPCDYMAWWKSYDETVAAKDQGCAAWIEVKQNDRLRAWKPELRPAQAAGAKQAAEIGLPYIVAVYWKKRNYWTLHQWSATLPAMTFEEAVSRYGVGTMPSTLSVVLAGVLNGEAGL